MTAYNSKKKKQETEINAVSLFIGLLVIAALVGGLVWVNIQIWNEIF